MNQPAVREGSTEPAPGSASPAPKKQCCAVSHWVLFSWLAIGITGLDLWSKASVFRILKVELVKEVVEGMPRLRVAPHEPIVIIPGFFELEANINYGAFSGWFSRHTEYLAVLSIAALLAIVWFLWNHLRGPGPKRLWFAAALGLLWGGTCGNLYDRAVLGYVRDFVKWFYVSSEGQQHVWPNFNVADSCILVGVSIILLTTFLKAPAQKPKET